jgi:polysaccharide biosynthesis transport protein
LQIKELSPWRIRPLSLPEDQQPEYSYPLKQDEISLGEYWHVLVKHRRMILLIFFIISGLGAYFALSATILYTATATLKIEPQNPQVTGVGELQQLELRGQSDYYQTQFVLLARRALAARVITELGLASKQAFTSAEVRSPNPVSHITNLTSRVLKFFSSYIVPLFPAKPLTGESQILDSTGGGGKLPIELAVSADLIDQYLGFLTVLPQENTRLVNVNFTTPHPTLSQALANAHIQAFMRMSLESRFGLTKEARDFLDQKKSELRQNLEKAETALNAFRRTHGVLSVEKGENIVVDRLVDLNKQLTAARGQRIEAESLYRTVENRSNQDVLDIMKQGMVQQLKSDIAKLESEKARLATVFKPDHPGVQELNQQIAAARQALNKEIADVVRGIRSNYAAALAKEKGLQAEADNQQRDALQLREVGVEYSLLQEEVNTNRNLYQSLLKRLSETNVSNDLAVSNMQIAEWAAKPRSPSGPNVTVFLMASMFSGLLLGVGLAFLREFFDSTVGTPEEVWRSVGLGTLGVVPHLKFLRQSTYNGGQTSRIAQGNQYELADAAPAKDLIINQNPLSIVNESYRAIRTSLLLARAEKPPQVVLLTSPSPGEGKTTTSLNLAISLAQDGRIVLLVDGDMRNGNCHDRLGLRNHRGLSNVLTGGLSLKEGIQQTQVNGLSLLSCGVRPPNPSELLGSRKMTEIIKELRQNFEFILIDSPPMIPISDAAILSVVADGVILIFNSVRTSTAYAQKAVARIDMVRAPLLGVILNAVNLDNPNYSYYRTYSHYYHQGPNENEELDERSAKDSDERVTTLQSIQAYLYKRFHRNDQGNGESARQNREGGWAEPFGNESLREVNEGATFKSAYAPPTTAVETAHSHGGKSDESLSQAFLNRLMDIFMESVGPVAPFIVGHHIGLLGESKEAFPKSRIDELIKFLAPEISQPEIRLRFQKKIAEEIQNLENQ